MKLNLLNTVICLLTFSSLALTSCKKSDGTAPETSSDNIQLLKISSWNPSTGAESASTEFTYESNGRLKTISSARVNLTPSYNAAGKVTLALGSNSTGGVVSYAMEYNAAGQLTKVVYIYMNPTDFGYTKTFTYNAAGKLVRTSSLGAAAGSTPYVIDYVWNGDNIASSTTTSSSSNFTTTYVSYDDKLNPYSLGDGFAAIIAGSPQSKNNFTELKVTYAATVSTQKRNYTYNSSGYASSLALADGSNEGTKFYYNK